MNPAEKTLKNQILALAGVAQAALLVDKLARTGIDDAEAFDTLVHGLLELHPANTEAVFIDRRHLRPGLETLQNLLRQDQRKGGTQLSEVLRYTLSMLHVERKLNSDKAMLGTIGKRLEQVKRQIELFNPGPDSGALHQDRVLSNIAALYTDTISTFRFRIQVNGNPRHLQQEVVVHRIRCLLLCGIRAAVLWRQVGGNRFTLLFNRKKHVAMASELLA